MSNETNNNEYLLKVDHLKQYFPVHDLSLIHISEPTRPY